MKGWIKLHRTIMKSETFSRLTAIQQLIAIYIILNANHEDGIWYDKYKDIELPVKRGQLVVSRNKIANEWFKNDKEVTEQRVRTTLKKLEKLKFLTITSTNNYTLLEVHNYCTYQEKDNEANQVSNQEETNSQPRDNQEKTTNKNDKNAKNKKDYTPQIKNLFSRYSSETKDLITAYWNVVKQTRKSGEIQKSVIYKAMDEWSKFDEIVVKYALKVHVESHSDKSEKYTLGIMRSTTPSQASDRLDMKPYKKKEEPTGRYIPEFDEIDLTAGED